VRQLRTKSGANSESAGALNKRVVLRALRLNGQLSRAEIARRTGLVPQTLSNIIEYLERDGLVMPTEPVKAGRARPSIPYAISPRGAFALGMQIDQHGARAVAVNLVGQVVARTECAFECGTLEQNLSRIQAALDEVLTGVHSWSGLPEPRVVGIGLAMPAPTGVHAVKDDAWMIAGRDVHPLAAAIEQHTGLPVSLHRDASAASVAERLNGCAIGIDNFVYIFVGYGLGAGLYVKGELYDGSHHRAGEFGQIPVPDGGSYVPMERIASLAPLYGRLGLSPNETHLFSRIEEALDSHAAPVAHWLDATARQLAWLIEVVACILDPACVVLGGQMPERLITALYDRLCERLAAQGLAETTMPRVLMGSADVFCVATGAAAYPIARAFDPSLSAILRSETH
jgi:predicted NBD/HSP70 family sugar kinase